MVLHLSVNVASHHIRFNWNYMEGEVMPIEDNGDVIDTAGYWTIGVTQGLMTAFIPVLVFSIGVGLAMRFAKTGIRIGRGE